MGMKSVDPWLPIMMFMILATAIYFIKDLLNEAIAWLISALWIPFASGIAFVIFLAGLWFLQSIKCDGKWNKQKCDLILLSIFLITLGQGLGVYILTDTFSN